MALDIPTLDDLQRLAESRYFTLSRDDAKEYRAVLDGIFPLLEQLCEMPAPAPARVGRRDRGARPEPGTDPYNAIVRRCSVVGASDGLLAGTRVGVKDNVCVAGIPMSWGSRVLRDVVPERDATIVTRLLDAGAQIVAILNMDNFAFSGRGDTSAYGPTLNPHDVRHLAGGSSGGSAAALYYDDIDVTIGADQGGSIRVPSSWCGVVGLKPTHGLVPYTGVGELDPTLDHAGPMARSVGEVARTLQAIAGKDPVDPRQDEVPTQDYVAALGRGVRGVRVGLVREGFGREGAEPDVDAAVRAAAAALGAGGAQVSEVSVPAHLTAGCLIWPLFAEGEAATLAGNGAGYHRSGGHDPALAEALGQGLQAHGDDLAPQLKLIVMLGTYLRERYHGRLYAKAQTLRPGLRASYDAALGEVDVLAMPTTPMKAHRVRPNLTISERITHGWNMVGNAAPFNLTGHPAISVPCALSSGLPVGLMLVGRRFDDAGVLAVARAFEEQGDWRVATG